MPLRETTFDRNSSQVSFAMGVWPSLLRLWWQRYRTRRQLAQLSVRELADIGCDRLAASQEAAKPFWKA